MANNNQNFNQYNTDINSTRNSNQNGLNINQNPYINSGVNQNFIGQNPNNQIQNQNGSFLNGDFIKGALIGAVATYILTNKNAQESIFQTINKAKTLVTAGIEELKERIEDAKAASQTNEQEF
ncbi:YtxH domain-containing protein [Arcobacter cryaerophilus gv. pseudocryaerophilus]|uniref:YtxH domain-containing protein n=3 Tax=Arcobacteraceae TaxID=2808963 RepID=A0AA96IIJ7_9BACT|nr:YtxH domain-containing protein [Arcobacter sp. AZ-2023]WNL36891.1 YtxH domain-containing protein [Arcobacter sp. AZ-2023]WPD12607.1 YtxH domain-containing protein [Arcobacter sp. DSM 115960]